MSPERKRRRPEPENAYDEAALQVEADGLGIPGRPSEDIPPQLPNDLPDMSSRALMALFVELTQWMEYQGVRLVRARTLESTLEDAIEKRTAMLIIAGWGGKDDRVAVARAQAAIDDEIQGLKDEKQKATAYRRLLETLHNATDRKVFTVSREITRRGDSEVPQRRSHRHGGA